ncbi:E3 ubiquitin-protein ligase MBR2 [Nicotiana tabacum]|uniref:RING-type E3 ubiquitin transferase n=1 Tax=Nicotiana tabacum TaxID=4097 RepID=A0A1S3XIG6_TOBAC|nr:PREDICTED: E3 ubiquitin-protein ligase MBR2-like [Nicotiana tabacum]XP_016439645.1 PREDICTED: E3 ubiquitin-protein ligase MBR2-like [Nicotiana tabacum]XP_016439646.1 PREDICTED: E3 ubiquitin-protein ligase MBR2-like [Nicotiana tabacum]
MQGNRSILDSFPETIDLNQVSVSNNASVDPTAPWDNLLNPVEDRLSNSMVSATRENPSCTNAASYNTQNRGGWDHGGSSSSANLHNIGHGSDLKIGHGWASSSSNYATTNPKSEERRFEPSNIFLPESTTSGYGGNHMFGSPPNLPNLASAHSPGNANLTGAYNHGDTRLVVRPSVSPIVQTSSGRLEAERPASHVSYNVGMSSGSSSYWAGPPDISSSSMGNWGLSCKRKALEGSSRQSCGGSSSSNAEPENVIQHNFPNRYDASSGLNVSPASASVQNTCYLENLFPRNGVGTGVAASDTFPPLSASGVAETSARNFGGGPNLGNQDAITFGFPPTGTDLGRSSGGSSLVTPRAISVTNSLSSRQPIPLPTNSGNPGSHSGGMRISGVPRGLHPVPWNASPNSRGGSSSSPNMVSGDRYAALQAEANFRSSIRNNREPHPFVPAPETRNMVHDPTNWSLATSNASYSRNTPSSSASGHGTSALTFPTAWMPNQNSATSSNHSFSEFAPWTPVGSGSGSQRGPFSLLPSAASSLEEAEMSSRSSSRGSSSRRNHQLHLRSTSVADFSGNDVDGWRGLAADIEGRHRLIRQVLRAMRRAENMRSEDYMMFDPFVNGVAELHDRHRDMRLDVDNMSYEELLALEERIGNVNTGLSEETILGHMKQRKHEPLYGGSSSNMEPCCICREEYITGDDMGILDCGHEFHCSCIKQWLMLKNLCPICKMTALDA